jgi:hypothetical protein
LLGAQSVWEIYGYGYCTLLIITTQDRKSICKAVT